MFPRARRSEYWYFTLFNILVTIVLNIVRNALPILSWLSVLYGIAAIVPGLAVCFRRLHDTGCSGAFVLLALIPLIGGLVFFRLSVKIISTPENAPPPRRSRRGCCPGQ